MTATAFAWGLNSFGEVATDGDRLLSDAETGSPETVARAIATMARDLRLSCFDLTYDVMNLPREARARTIELLGREIAPPVQQLFTKEPTHV